MRKRTVVTFNVRELPDEEVRAMFDRGGRFDVPVSGSAGFYAVEFWGDASELPRFRAELRAAGRRT